MDLRVICLAVLFVVFGAGRVESQTLWEHNGSIVSLEASGANRKFVYSEPRTGLPVRPGTLLFNGRKEGNSFSGTAYVFHSKCGPRGYSVKGPVSGDRRVVTMYGQAPRVDANCRVIGGRDDTLVFTLLERNAKRPREDGLPIKITKSTPGLHIPVRLWDSTIYVRMAQDEHFVYMVEDSLDALKKKRDILVLEKPGLRNGFAMLLNNAQGSGKTKVVIFDPTELEHLRKRLGNRTDAINSVAALFTLGHEIGHHVCNHIVDGAGSRPWKELQADRVAGAILSRSTWREFFGAGTLKEYERAMRLTLDAAASETHPGIEERIAAFREGWLRNRGCE